MSLAEWRFINKNVDLSPTSIMFRDQDVVSKMEIHKQNGPEFTTSSMSEARVQC